MKKRLYSIIIVLLFLVCSNNNNAFGQFITSADATNDTMRYDTCVSHEFQNSITNNSPSSIVITWHVNMSSSYLPANWTASPCDFSTCYAYDGTIHTSPAFAAGATKNWLLGINPSGTAGTGWVTEIFTDNVDTTSKKVVYVVTCSTTGVSKMTLSDEDVIVFPNPAKNELNAILTNMPDIKTIVVKNTIGKSVGLCNINGNNAKLNIENLPPGIYFICLIDANSSVITTRKFTKL